MLKLLENHVKTQLYERFFQIFELGNIFEILTKKSKKHDFFAKNHFFGIFWSKFSNILPKLKIWKKNQSTLPPHILVIYFQSEHTVLG